MIPQTELTVDSKSWQEQLKSSIRDLKSLAQHLELDKNQLIQARPKQNHFALKVPESYVARMEKGNINDPLLRQVLPIEDELLVSPGFTNNPVGDLEANPLPGLIHKYHGRVLLIASGHCAVHCRYCFRREFPYSTNRPNREQWDEALAYIANDPSIEEVILSGGDPLSLTDKKLAQLVNSISKIAHVSRLRVHTRLPVVIPSRITTGLVEGLTNSRLDSVMVLHINHPNEINDELAVAALQLKQSGITLLNQSVLLKGVNDSSKILCQLSKKLFEAGILPYYLHLLDKVSGAAHFNVEERQAKQLHHQLKVGLPGYLVPKLVKEVKKMPFKQALT